MMRVLNNLTVLVGLVLIASAGGVMAVDVAEITPAVHGPSIPGSPIFLLPPAADEELFVGTGAFSGSVANPSYTVDVDDGSNTQSFSGTPVGGAAFDAANNRLLFTSSITTDYSEIWEWPLTGTPTQVGTITLGGQPLRIDGLGVLGATLYGVHQFGDTVSAAGIFSIDTSSFVATSVLPFPAGAATDAGLSGLAGDGASGLLYAPDDNGGQILSLDPVGGTVAVVAAYPAGQTDIDGAAFGDGTVYLVTDDSAGIFPYNLAAGGYGTTIASPFGAADTFSGAAFLAAAGPSDADLALQLSCGLAGGGVDCTATVNNLGPDDASGVVVTVTIPGGLTYAGDGCMGSAMAGVWTWNLGSLMAGASDACTVSMTVDAGSSGPWIVIGSVAHAGNDPDPSNDRSTEQVSLISPIPTLSDAGMVMLILGLIVGALIVLRRTF